MKKAITIILFLVFSNAMAISTDLTNSDWGCFDSNNSIIFQDMKKISANINGNVLRDAEIASISEKDGVTTITTKKSIHTSGNSPRGKIRVTLKEKNGKIVLLKVETKSIGTLLFWNQALFCTNDQIKRYY